MNDAYLRGDGGGAPARHRPSSPSTRSTHPGVTVSRHRPLLRLIPVALALAAATTPARSQSPSPSATTALTPELSLTLRRPSDLRFSPDGRRLAFVVDEPPDGTERRRHVWMLDVRGGEARPFTHSAGSEGSPRWSPDGSMLAFTSDRDGTERLYLMHADGGEAWKLTRGKESVGSFAWSPDGRLLAFLARDTTTAEEEAKKEAKDDARVVDRDERRTRVWLADASSGEARPVSDARWEVDAFVWGPGGRELFASATDRPASDENTGRVVSIALGDGSVREIAAPRGPFWELRLSPDGRTLYWVGCRVDGPEPHDLMALSLPDGAPRNLTEWLDRPVDEIAWRPDGSLLARVQLGFQDRLVALAADGARRPLDMPERPSSVSAFAVSSSGRIAVVGQSATEPPELYLVDGRGAATRVTHVNDAWSAVHLVDLERFRYASFDGTEIEGGLLLPASRVGGARLPLVTLVHGGPTGAWHDAIETWGQLLATRGYAVFYPNPRGSTGYGEAFMEANRGDWGGGDFRDVMVGIDTLIARGVADPDRLGIGGWSYGGYMSEWAITQTDRFDAAVTGAGMANLISEFGTEGGSAYDEWFYGLPWERPEGFLKSSPFMYLRNAQTPTLILQGEADLTDPLGQSQELYRGLKRYGVEAELVVYPREPHGLREEQHLLDRLRRILDWYDRHVK